MTAPDCELPIFVTWVSFLEWLLNVTSKFPKKVRFTFTSRLDNLALDLLELIIEARYSRHAHKLSLLKQINLKLEKLRVLLRICHQQQHLSSSAYEYASKQLTAVGQMVGGWIKQQS